MPFTTEITTDLNDTTKSLDELALARSCVMAVERLNQEEFDSFILPTQTLIERRRLQNDKIKYD